MTQKREELLRMMKDLKVLNKKSLKMIKSLDKSKHFQSR